MKSQSKIIGFLNGYEAAEESLELSGSGHAIGKTLYAQNICGVNSKLSHAIYAGRLTALFAAIGRVFAATATRAYGLFLLAFGGATLLLNFGAFYFFRTNVQNIALPLALGAICALLAIPALLSESPIGTVFRRTSLADFILFDFLCIKRPVFSGQQRAIPAPLMPFFGIALATIGFFTSTPLLVLCLFALIFLWISIDSPETPFLLSLVTIPYLPLLPHGTTALTVVIGIAVLSFARKVILGNRVFHFEQYDFFLLLFAAIVLITDLIRGGLQAMPDTLTYLAMLLGYPLAGNLLANQRLLERASEAIAFSSAPIALLAIYQYVGGVAEFRWLDASFLSQIDGRAVATFHNPNVLAVFLLCGTMFSLMLAQRKRHVSKKILYLLFTVLNVSALVFTWSRGAWIALGLGVIACFVIRFRRRPGLIVSFFAILPLSVLLLPESVRARLLSAAMLTDSSIAYRLSIWRSSLRMIADRLWLGVGHGEKLFGDAFLHYAEDAVVAPHAHNVFLAVISESGLLGFLCFAAFLIARARHLTAYRRPLQAGRNVRTVTLFSCATSLSCIVFGMTDHIFYYLPLCYLFFAVFGIGSSALRIGKRDFDDRFGYDDDHTSDAAAVNIDLLG